MERNDKDIIKSLWGILGTLCSKWILRYLQIAVADRRIFCKIVINMIVDE